MKHLLTVLVAFVCVTHDAHGQSEANALPTDPFYVAAHTASELPVITPNDNRDRAGTLNDGVLRVALEIRRGVLYPETEDEPGLRVEAISETGQIPTIPAPMLRVSEGTTLEVKITNLLSDSTVTVFGLRTRPMAPPDSLVLRPGERTTVSFLAGEPGTYWYRAQIGAPNTGFEDPERGLTSGAFIIDPAGPVADDRVIVMNIWSQPDSTMQFGGYNTLLVNGKSWPFTERIKSTVGITERWHVVNATGRNHPMHLHGFFYHVLGYGTTDTFDTYATEDHREVVTEPMRGYQAMLMEWTPSREGNWLFHCHISFHVGSGNRLPGSSENHAIHMSGLVLGINVAPGETDLIDRGEPRHITLNVDEYEGPSRVRFAFNHDEVFAPGPEFHSAPGPALILQQYQPTFVTVVNRMRSPTGVHWHGLELDSWADGVPNWSSSAGKTSPVIQPGESFTYKLSLMRPGSFIYHSHLDDVSQLGKGLYGALIVMPPGEELSPVEDHIYVWGWREDDPVRLEDVELNGISITESQPEIHTIAGSKHRLRLIHIAAAGNITMQMFRDGVPFPIRSIAKDGADLPVNQQKMLETLPRLFIGETVDLQFNPDAPGTYTLKIGYGDDSMASQTWIVN